MNPEDRGQGEELAGGRVRVVIVGVLDGVEEVLMWILEQLAGPPRENEADGIGGGRGAANDFDGDVRGREGGSRIVI